MTTPILAIKCAIDVAKTYDTPKTITAITKASPGVATSAGHGLANGTIGVFAAEGMAELDGQVVRVAATATNTFELEGIDTTDYGTFTSGTFTPISAWDRLGNAQGLSASQAQPNRIDTTTLLDESKQYVFGLPDSPQITINGLLDPFSDAVKNWRTASRRNDARVVLVTFKNGIKYVTNGFLAGGDGFEAQGGDAMKQSYALTQIKQPCWFAS